MTKSTITRERLQEIAEDGFLKHGESKALARMALAAMDSEPYGFTDGDRRGMIYKPEHSDRLSEPVPVYRHAQPVLEIESEPVFTLEVARADYKGQKLGNHFGFITLDAARELKEGNYQLYTAQPAPVVPEEMTIRDACKFVQDMRLFDDVSVIVMRTWNACRAAMLEAAPQLPGSEPATVPGKWIPVSDRMPEEGGRYWCYVEEQNSLGKSHYQWNCSWNGDVWSDKALTGRVTHWMPPPAAPKEGKP